MILKTKDEAIRDIADEAKDQCESLTNKLSDVLEGFDEDGEADKDRLCGIAKDKTGRSMLVFSEYGQPGRRYVVYVDKILSLARILNSEHRLEDED